MAGRGDLQDAQHADAYACRGEQDVDKVNGRYAEDHDLLRRNDFRMNIEERAAPERSGCTLTP